MNQKTARKTTTLFALAVLVLSLLSVGMFPFGQRVEGRVSAPEAASAPGESGCTDADFTQPVTSPEAVGDGPASVAVGDFNLDGRPDFAAANLSSDNVTIML